MSRSPGGLASRIFDVLVIGGGANGASTAQHLSAQGHSVLLVEQRDFASGTSSRSSRVLSCGAFFLTTNVPPESKPGPLQLLRLALEAIHGLPAARRSMLCRTQMVTTSRERLTPFTFYYPVYADSSHSGWHVDLAFKALSLFGSREVPLDYKRWSKSQALELPLVKHLANPDKFDSVIEWKEYQYNWAERICMDAVVDAERLGAVVLNYTTVRRLELEKDRWKVEIEGTVEPGDKITVYAKVLVNACGAWVDRVNSLSVSGKPRRHVAVTRHTHALFKFPDDCANCGMQWLNSLGRYSYCCPWGQYHYIGPTASPFSGDPLNARPTEAEIDFLIREVNLNFPTFKLSRSDLILAWTGCSGHTVPPGAEEVPVNLGSGKIHDLASDGMPNAFAITEVPIMFHRHFGRTVAGMIAQRLAPSHPEQELSFAVPPYLREFGAAPPQDLNVSATHLREIAKREHVKNLDDLLFRRVKLGWGGELDRKTIEFAARSVADILGWDEGRLQREVETFIGFAKDNFMIETKSAIERVRSQ